MQTKCGFWSKSAHSRDTISWILQIHPNVIAAHRQVHMLWNSQRSLIKLHLYEGWLRALHPLLNLSRVHPHVVHTFMLYLLNMSRVHPHSVNMWSTPLHLHAKPAKHVQGAGINIVQHVLSHLHITTCSLTKLSSSDTSCTHVTTSSSG